MEGFLLRIPHSVQLYWGVLVFFFRLFCFQESKIFNLGFAKDSNIFSHSIFVVSEFFTSVGSLKRSCRVERCPWWCRAPSWWPRWCECPALMWQLHRKCTLLFFFYTHLESLPDLSTADHTPHCNWVIWAWGWHDRFTSVSSNSQYVTKITCYCDSLHSNLYNTVHYHG